jgi:uncharacterized peroxidase-related enzyme
VPHIFLDPTLPGITSLLAYRRETAKPLMDLAEELLRGESPLTRGERELIAAYVSEHNDCEFCAASHGACAGMLLPEGTPLVEQVRKNPDEAPISGKLRTLLAIAGAVAEGGWAVTEEHIAAARAAGAEDRDIHDTVLVAAAFCMYNRYVDGLATLTPHDPAAYAMMAERLVNQGYTAPRAPGGGSANTNTEPSPVGRTPARTAPPRTVPAPAAPDAQPAAVDEPAPGSAEAPAKPAPAGARSDLLGRVRRQVRARIRVRKGPDAS